MAEGRKETGRQAGEDGRIGRRGDGDRMERQSRK